MEAAAAVVAASSDWWFFSSNFSYPDWDNISDGPWADKGHFAVAAEVFEVLQLDLKELSTIFITDNPVSYTGLGPCRIGDFKAWNRLAKLAQKTIHLVYCDGEPSGEEITCFPLYRLGNQPEEYALKENYLGWTPEGKDWDDLCIQLIRETTLTIVSPKDGRKKELFLHHFILKEAFPLSFYGEERARNWHRFAIVSSTETSERFIIPLH